MKKTPGTKKTSGMKKTLRRKFILFAMSAVTVLLAVLIGAISGFSWIVLDHQSDSILHTLVRGGERFPQRDFRHPKPFAPSTDMDTLLSARFFTVLTDPDGAVLSVNLDRISSVSEERAARYAAEITGVFGKIDGYKYEVKQIGADRLIFFMDTAGQFRTFLMVFCISSVLAVFCWFLMLIFAVLFSGRVVRPVLAGIEKQKQFITNAGHELKTPLAVIQSNNDAATLIYGENKYSRNIRLQTRRLNVLMTNLLTLAKLDEEAKLPAERVDISGVIGEMLSACEYAVAEKQITLCADIRPDVFLQVHRDTFSQMISILTDNAVRYTPKGGTIAVSVWSDGGHVGIAEENTCEIPADSDPERLFERFYRGDAARTQSSPSSGYGIGLSAARAIAETFGGTLTAEYPEEGKIRFTARF